MRPPSRSAAMDEDHDRKPLARLADRGAPDIEEQAIFLARAVDAGLRAGGAEPGGDARLAPSFRRARRGPAARSGDAVGIGNPAKDLDAAAARRILRDPANRTGAGANDLGPGPIRARACGLPSPISATPRTIPRRNAAKRLGPWRGPAGMLTIEVGSLGAPPRCGTTTTPAPSVGDGAAIRGWRMPGRMQVCPRQPVPLPCLVRIADDRTPSIFPD